MKWWKLFRPHDRHTAPADPPDLGKWMPQWEMVKHDERQTMWRDTDGDALSLTRGVDFGLLDLSDENAVRAHCRNLAKSSASGLIEAAVVERKDGPVLTLVYKRLDMPAYVFTGMLVVAPTSGSSSVWIIVARERGMTGVREAVVAAQLMKDGSLSLESYQTSWAKDPYDPTYGDVDRRTLRFISDDESWDLQFPRHPLSKVRRQLRELLAVTMDI
jgi:hypothetical protein